MSVASRGHSLFPHLFCPPVSIMFSRAACPSTTTYLGSCLAHHPTDSTSCLTLLRNMSSQAVASPTVTRRARLQRTIKCASNDSTLLCSPSYPSATSPPIAARRNDMHRTQYLALALSAGCSRGHPIVIATTAYLSKESHKDL
jgi:hypothetical protein